MPECFKPVQEDATPSLNPQLSQLFLLAMPTIAPILAVDDTHPVMRNFKLHFKSTSWNVQASLNWIWNRSFDPSAALQEMLTPIQAGRRERESDGEEVFLEEPVPKRHKLAAGKKLVRTATPPSVRRSGRLKDL
ncbi:hypothetical protein K438DRAFT_1751217 [Mycena galopus ATCC 62051]|nr:hypothetical protein K438DRAFT_1751217 [Mycena galopus ATCC 62051]